ncbi:MAG: hypothetical protein JNL10_03100 [Verrucomicrobiales bacterium]|nr:hypothetical protein [Verrucomicrobiales bacterium]
MEAVLNRLVEELERPRELTAQTLRHLEANYGITREDVGTFLEERLAGLDDTEIDLALSAQYTPKLADQAVFAALLGTAGVPVETLPGWITELVQRPTMGRLVTPDGLQHAFAMRAVTLERYVLRLRLEATIPESTGRLIRSLCPVDRQPLLLAIARRAIWNTEGRRALLRRYLAVAYAGDPPPQGDAEQFLALAETSEPEDENDARVRLPAWEQVARTQWNGSDQPSPFFNERVQDLHGGGRDQRGPNEALRARKKAELEFLGRLGRILSV